MSQKKIYIAGPEVFLSDGGTAYYDKVRELLSAKQVIPMICTDNKISGALNIRNANIDMIKECDAIIADLSPFRSHEPDCGTAFEVGYAAARGKQILVYTSDLRSMTEKYGGTKDADGLTIEDFSLPFNLMLYDGTPIFGSFEEAFEYFCKTSL
ncbi:unnamed protein product [Phytomonas sp. Hart1]|nr:unnamed protein product [Phytomonas sp. Hart1]|eukprot:CCW68218.1 unnamed protein product [Phytomonas sp. isolate Hart1]